jgi:hypothetical protein
MALNQREKIAQLRSNKAYNYKKQERREKIKLLFFLEKNLVCLLRSTREYFFVFLDGVRVLFRLLAMSSASLYISF